MGDQWKKDLITATTLAVGERTGEGEGQGQDTGLEQVRALIEQTGGRPSLDWANETGMTPLQYAAYLGKADIVRLMLQQDCDPKFSKHEHDYTALHFGALSGNAEVCTLLLAAGADPTATNSIGRTAAQIAAFVGNHKIVSTINNFVPMSEIEYFTKPQGHRTEPVLPPSLADAMHSFVIDVNLNPVRVVLNLQRLPGLSDNLAGMKLALETMRSKEMEKGGETDEVMALKFHYLSRIVDEVMKIKEIQTCSKDPKKDEDSDDKRCEFVEAFSKRMLKPGRDGVTLESQEKFIKEAIREFPHRECITFRQIVMSLGGKDPPSAFSVINSLLNGSRGFVNSIPICNTCGEEKPAKKCSKCKSVQYCDRECQRLHWFTHKKSCNRLSSNPPSTAQVETPREVDTFDLSEHLQNVVKMS